MGMFFFKNTKSNRVTVLIDCDFVWENWELISEREYNKIAISRGLCSSQEIRQNSLDNRAERATGRYININGKRVTGGN